MKGLIMRNNQFSANEIGTRILRARQSKGISQSDLAKAIGVTQSAIAQFETGKNKPTLKSMIALSNHLNIQLHKLAGATQ